jgi:phosphate transport system protein
VRYHQHLEAIESKVIELFALVADGMAGVTDALLAGDRDLVAVLAERESVIDALYLEIEDLVNQLVALQAPVARDLRFLLSVLRIVPELERSHDLVVHIARLGQKSLGDEISPRSRGLLDRMGRLGTEMWRQAGDCWYQRDGAAAALLEIRDDEMDELHAALVAEIASGRMPLSVAMDMTLVARFYERLGDHAVNIARRVVYLASPTFSTVTAARAT